MRSRHFTETELKLAVAAGDLPQLLARLSRYGAPQRGVLDSLYFDTRDRRLAAAGLALRLRLADGRWWQTLKAGGALAALATRGEWEQPARVVRGRPQLDWKALAATPLPAALGAAGPRALKPLFRTRFERARWNVAHRGARIEAALDVGEITAGTRREPICELELELQQGEPAALPDFALHLVGRGKRALALLPAAESKSARGHRLAANQRPTPQKANAKAFADLLGAQQPLPAAVRAFAARALDLLLLNAAGARVHQDPEFVHQARVALRRLRSVLRVLRPWVDVPGPLRAELRWVARALGTVRDLDVLIGETAAQLLPALPVRVRTAVRHRLRQAHAQARAALHAVLGSARFARALLAALRWVAQRSDRDGPPLAAVAAEALAPLQRRLAKAAPRFAALSPRKQHRVRIEAKRLRYALDFFAAALPAAEAKRLSKTLAALQDALGALNDLEVAQAWLRPLLPQAAQRRALQEAVRVRREPHLRAAARGLRTLVRRFDALQAALPSPSS